MSMTASSVFWMFFLSGRRLDATPARRCDVTVVVVAGVVEVVRSIPAVVDGRRPCLIPETRAVG